MGMRMKQKRRSKVKPVYAGSVRREIGLYTLGWGIGALFLILSFVITKRSFLWYPDGIYQHYTAFCKLCSTQNFIHRCAWTAIRYIFCNRAMEERCLLWYIRNRLAQ